MNLLIVRTSQQRSEQSRMHVGVRAWNLNPTDWPSNRLGILHLNSNRSAPEPGKGSPFHEAGAVQRVESRWHRGGALLRIIGSGICMIRFLFCSTRTVSLRSQLGHLGGRGYVEHLSTVTASDCIWGGVRAEWKQLRPWLQPGYRWSGLLGATNHADGA